MHQLKFEKIIQITRIKRKIQKRNLFIGALRGKIT